MTNRFDATLKLLLQGHASVLQRTLDPRAVVEWLNVEVEKSQARKLDLLARLSDGGLLHIELQTTNDPDMALRMLEYATGVYRQYRQFPKQVLLYVGKAALRMPDSLAGGRLEFGYRLVDFRDLDGDALLASDDLGDNVIAVLARLSDRRAAVNGILRRIARAEGSRRTEALHQLTLLAGLRGLEETVQEEIKSMPLVIDIMENQIIGPAYRRGVHVGEIELLRKLITRRFGPIPNWADQRLATKTTDELNDIGLRLLDAQSIEELLAEPRA